MRGVAHSGSEKGREGEGSFEAPPLSGPLSPPKTREKENNCNINKTWGASMGSVSQPQENSGVTRVTLGTA